MPYCRHNCLMKICCCGVKVWCFGNDNSRKFSKKEEVIKETNCGKILFSLHLAEMLETVISTFWQHNNFLIQANVCFWFFFALFKLSSDTPTDIFITASPFGSQKQGKSANFNHRRIDFRKKGHGTVITEISCSVFAANSIIFFFCDKFFERGRADRWKKKTSVLPLFNRPFFCWSLKDD